MRRYIRLVLTALVGGVLIVGITSNAFAQKPLKDQIVGTWTAISVENVNKDGSRRQEFGPSPKGMYIFEPNGYYVVVLTRPDVPKYASNDRLMGTAEENTAAAQGVLAFFGTYTVNEADHTLNFHIERSTFPNWSGTDQKRSVTITGDEMKYTNAAASGGGKAELVWKRAK